MAAKKNVSDVRLQIRFNNGTTASGKVSVKTLSLGQIKLGATDQELPGRRQRPGRSLLPSPGRPPESGNRRSRRWLMDSRKGRGKIRGLFAWEGGPVKPDFSP